MEKVKFLIIKNNVVKQSIVSMASALFNNYLATIKIDAEIDTKISLRQYTGQAFSNAQTVGSGIGVNPEQILQDVNGLYNVAILICDADKITPKPTNPTHYNIKNATGCTPCSIPTNWYEGAQLPETPESVLCQYMLHEYCHARFYLLGLSPDFVHLPNNRNIDTVLYDKWQVGQMRLIDFYLKLIKEKLMNTTNPSTPIQPTYKYFKPSEIVNLKPALVQMLDKARGIADTPFIISNGFRTPEQNAAIQGSAPNSAHMRGLAVDLHCNNTTRTKILRGLLTCGIPVFIEVAGTHVHVDIDGTIHPLGDTMWGNDPS